MIQAEVTPKSGVPIWIKANYHRLIALARLQPVIPEMKYGW